MSKRSRLWILSDTGSMAAGRSEAINGDGLPSRILQTFLNATGNAHTRDAKQRDLADFAEFFAADDLTPDVLARLVSLDAPGIIETLTAYKVQQRARGLSPSTINRRLASVRGLLRCGSRLGAACPDPAGLVPLEKTGPPTRDTEGPPLSDVARILGALDTSSVRGKRDYALLLLFTTNALRKSEALNANVGDFNEYRNRLRIKGKGQGGQSETVSLDAATSAAIAAYLAVRPDELHRDSPLFASCDRRAVAKLAGLRLSASGWEKTLADLGTRVLGERINPHSLRHTATTAALIATGGDIGRVQRLTRHKKADTLLIYRDRLKDDQGDVTRILAGLLRDAKDKAETPVK